MAVADGGIPSTAVLGGEEPSKTKQFPCRGVYNGGTQPGKLIEGTDACRIGYGGQEIKLGVYEVLREIKKDHQGGLFLC